MNLNDENMTVGQFISTMFFTAFASVFGIGLAGIVVAKLATCVFAK